MVKKHRRYKFWDTDFTVQSWNEDYKSSIKIIEKFTVRPKLGVGGRTIAPPPPEYATGCYGYKDDSAEWKTHQKQCISGVSGGFFQVVDWKTHRNANSSSG